MKSKIWAAITVALALTLCCAGAMAADVFRFEQRTLDLFEGESERVALIREGNPAEEGELTWTTASGKIATVSADGTVTGLQKGQTVVRAALKSGNRNWNASLTVNVLRRVTAVTLNTTRLLVYRSTDEEVSELLREETDQDVILVLAGRSFDLRATCTPSDANNKRVTFSSSDEGVLKVGQESARAMQEGECNLTVASAQNPEVKQVFRVLVIQPVNKITLSSPTGHTVSVGGSMRLLAEYEPANASIQKVTWTSQNPKAATVDENGVVTGVKKGNTTITAKAADGSGRTATFTVTVAQQATDLTIREEGLTLATNQLGYLHATVLPNDANDKSVTWSSSDEKIATVTAGGQVKGIRRGECTITATSKSNPAVTATVPVQVIQRVTAIAFPDGQVSLPIQTTLQLNWQVEPADATIQEVTFTSSNRKVATVDANGVVHGLTRGTSTITATATDGSNRRGQVRVTVTQPVEGVAIQYGVYHIQLNGSLNIKALISPQNANNQNVHFTMGDEYIATVKDRKNIGTVRGWHQGTTTITGTTEDGGYSATAEVRVADFNRAIVVDDLYLDGENIRIVLRNRSDFTVDRVYFTVETYDEFDQPLVCNADGVSNSFDGSYRLELGPDDRSQHYVFNFGDYVQPLTSIATVTLKVTGWRDLEGYTRKIPESEYPSLTYRRFIPAKPSAVLNMSTGNNS